MCIYVVPATRWLASGEAEQHRNTKPRVHIFLSFFLSDLHIAFAVRLISMMANEAKHSPEESRLCAWCISSNKQQQQQFKTQRTRTAVCLCLCCTFLFLFFFYIEKHTLTNNGIGLLVRLLLFLLFHFLRLRIGFA